jgi:hypothetical protein
MTSILTQDCCRTMVFARVSPRSEFQNGPTAVEIGAQRVGCSKIAFIRAHLVLGSFGTHNNRAVDAGAGSGGGRSSAINHRISANSVLGTATSAIWKAVQRPWLTTFAPPDGGGRITAAAASPVQPPPKPVASSFSGRRPRTLNNLRHGRLAEPCPVSPR